MFLKSNLFISFCSSYVCIRSKIVLNINALLFKTLYCWLYHIGYSFVFIRTHTVWLRQRILSIQLIHILKFLDKSQPQRSYKEGPYKTKRACTWMILDNSRAAYTLFFIRTNLYKNNEAQICRRVKNMFRTIEARLQMQTKLQNCPLK